MKVKLLYFAGVREAAGRTSDIADLPSGATVGTALEWLAEAHPGAVNQARTARVAVNQEFAQPGDLLSDGDEVVFIPPVSGGSGVRARLTHDPMEPHEAGEMIDANGAGAIIHFTGVVRPTSKKGRDVDTLDYEAYEPMAVKKLEQCLAEACAQFPVLDAAVVHRLGHLTLGEVAVSIAVSSKHRKEAFEAAQYIIDRLKEIVPIWKKETGPDGAEWVSEGA